jgi:chromosome partitioning protein
MSKCIAFHSYKGGTGKTTIASNFAALLAKKGYKVFLLDLDVYAPSMQSYFKKEPKKWINDYLYANAELDDVLLDLTPTISEKNYDGAKNKNHANGRLWVAFSNSKKEEIYKLEGGTGGGGGAGKQDTSKIQLLRRFILLREQLISQYDADYIIIDTSPGIRYWSINALAVADTLFLTLKMGDLDIEGTRKMADEIYGSFTKFGAKSYLLLNRVDGYCVPLESFDTKRLSSPASTTGTTKAGTTIAPATTNLIDNTHSISFETGLPTSREHGYSDVIQTLSNNVRMNVISAIPCYCDIQFSRREYLTALEHPAHPFASKVEELIKSMEAI